MPIVTTRLEKRIYHARISGEYDNAELIQVQREQMAYVQRYNDYDYIVIAQQTGKWKASKDVKTWQVLSQNMHDLQLMIFVGWSPAMQILAKALFSAFRMREKIAFASTLEDAVVKARAIIRQEQGLS